MNLVVLIAVIVPALPAVFNLLALVLLFVLVIVTVEAALVKVVVSPKTLSVVPPLTVAVSPGYWAVILFNTSTWVLLIPVIWVSPNFSQVFEPLVPVAIYSLYIFVTFASLLGTK